MRSPPRRRDALLFTAATGVVAVHAVADAFVAPEPGTGWRDHLLRGGVTLALLAAAALAYPRLRAGARALLAGVLGVLAVEGAVLAVVDAGAGGARGEDWTGFLLLAAGPALCALAFRLLWRSRRPGRLRHLRRAALGVGAAVGAVLVVVPVATAIFATHRPRSDVSAPGLGRPYRTVSIRTSDGLDLAGWYVPSRNGAAVISLPSRKGKLPQARMLVRHGYGVLLLDMRGYDGSEGDANMFGWGAARDVDAAVRWLRRQPDVRGGRIGGIGFSVGGEMMLEAAAGNPGLRAVVSEGAGVRSVREVPLLGSREWAALPQQAVQTAALAVLSGTRPPPSLDDLMPRIAPRPVLLIYAAHGQGGEELSRTYFRAARGARELWRVATGGHTGAFEAQPRAYERRVVGFFDRALVDTR